MTALISPRITVPCQTLTLLPKKTSPIANEKNQTCNGSVGCDKHITDDDWTEIVQMQHCSSFGVFLCVFSSSFELFG